MSESVPGIRILALLSLLVIAFVFSQEVPNAIWLRWYEDASLRSLPSNAPVIACPR